METWLKPQWKSDESLSISTSGKWHLKNFKWALQIEDDGGIFGKYTCVQVIAIKKMIQLQTHCVILFGFRKGKTDNLSYQLRAISCFLINLHNTRARKKPLLWTVVEGRAGNQAWQKFCSLNAIYRPQGRGLGEIPGVIPGMFCQKITIPIRRPGARFWVSDPEPWWRVLDSGEKWVVWYGCISKAIVSLVEGGHWENSLSQSAPGSIRSWDYFYLLCELLLFPLRKLLSPKSVLFTLILWNYITKFVENLSHFSFYVWIIKATMWLTDGDLVRLNSPL